MAEREAERLEEFRELFGPAQDAAAQALVAEAEERHVAARDALRATEPDSRAERKAERALQEAVDAANRAWQDARSSAWMHGYLSETDRLLELSGEEIWREYVQCERRNARRGWSDPEREDQLITALRSVSKLRGYGLRCPLLRNLWEEELPGILALPEVAAHLAEDAQDDAQDAAWAAEDLRAYGDGEVG